MPTDTTTVTFTSTPTGTITPSTTATPPATLTSTASPTPLTMSTQTFTPTLTSTFTPTWTHTVTRTATRTATPTLSVTLTVTSVANTTTTSTPSVTWTLTPAASSPTWTSTPEPPLPTPTLTSTRVILPGQHLPGETAPVVIRQNVVRPASNQPVFVGVWLDRTQHVTVRIYTQSGQLVKVVEDRVADAGSFETSWSGINQNGNVVGSGVYFVEIQTERLNEKRKLVVVR